MNWYEDKSACVRVDFSVSQLLDGVLYDKNYCDCIPFRSHRAARLKRRCVPKINIVVPNQIQ